MNICFIGSNGFMATAFGRFFEKKGGAAVHVIGRSRPGYGFASFEKMDLSSGLPDMAALAGFDVVFYFAAAATQGGHSGPADEIYRINTFLPIEIATALNQKNFAGTFVTFGSYAEIGSNDDDRAFDETAILQSTAPVPNDYTTSKRLLTRFAGSFGAKFRLLHFIVPTIYGPGENENRLIPYLLNCHRGSKPIQLTSGNQTRQYLFVGELPEIVQRSLGAGLETGIYNVAGPDTMRVRDIVMLVAKIGGIPAESIEFNTINKWDTGMNALVLDGKKLETRLGLRAVSRLEDNIASYLAG